MQSVVLFTHKFSVVFQSALHGSHTAEVSLLSTVACNMILSCLFLFSPSSAHLPLHLDPHAMTPFPLRPSPPPTTPAPGVNGLQEPGLAKRLRGTPERIELENYRLSLQREEELEEVPEETLAEHNLSSVLDKPTDADLGSR